MAARLLLAVLAAALVAPSTSTCVITGASPVCTTPATGSYVAAKAYYNNAGKRYYGTGCPGGVATTSCFCTVRARRRLGAPLPRP